MIQQLTNYVVDTVYPHQELHKQANDSLNSIPLLSSLNYQLFLSKYNLQSIILDNRNGDEWQFYDTGPSSKIPLVCIPGTTGTADMFYQQILTLNLRGYRIISLTIPAIKTMAAFISSFSSFLRCLNVECLHLLGTSLGGYLALCYAQKYPKRVLSIILTNSFTDTAVFQQNTTWFSGMSTADFMPEFYLRRYITQRLAAINAKRDINIALAADFVLKRTESLSKQQLHSRCKLNLSTDEINVSPIAAENITIIDPYDNSMEDHDNMRIKLYDVFKNANYSLLKTGGHFPYLSMHQQYTMLVRVHLRRNGASTNEYWYAQNALLSQKQTLQYNMQRTKEMQLKQQHKLRNSNALSVSLMSASAVVNSSNITSNYNIINGEIDGCAGNGNNMEKNGVFDHRRHYHNKQKEFLFCEEEEEVKDGVVDDERDLDSDSSNSSFDDRKRDFPNICIADIVDIEEQMNNPSNQYMNGEKMDGEYDGTSSIVSSNFNPYKIANHTHYYMITDDKKRQYLRDRKIKYDRFREYQIRKKKCYKKHQKIKQKLLANKMMTDEQKEAMRFDTSEDEFEQQKEIRKRRRKRKKKLSQKRKRKHGRVINKKGSKIHHHKPESHHSSEGKARMSTNERRRRLKNEHESKKHKNHMKNGASKHKRRKQKRKEKNNSNRRHNKKSRKRKTKRENENPLTEEDLRQRNNEWNENNIPPVHYERHQPPAQYSSESNSTEILHRTNFDAPPVQFAQNQSVEEIKLNFDVVGVIDADAAPQHCDIISPSPITNIDVDREINEIGSNLISPLLSPNDNNSAIASSASSSATNSVTVSDTDSDEEKNDNNAKPKRKINLQVRVEDEDCNIIDHKNAAIPPVIKSFSPSKKQAENQEQMFKEKREKREKAAAELKAEREKLKNMTAQDFIKRRMRYQHRRMNSILKKQSIYRITEEHEDVAQELPHEELDDYGGRHSRARSVRVAHARNTSSQSSLASSILIFDVDEMEDIDIDETPLDVLQRERALSGGKYSTGEHPRIPSIDSNAGIGRIVGDSSPTPRDNRNFVPPESPTNYYHLPVDSADSWISDMDEFQSAGSPIIGMEFPDDDIDGGGDVDQFYLQHSPIMTPTSPKLYEFDGQSSSDSIQYRKGSQYEVNYMPSSKAETLEKNSSEMSDIDYTGADKDTVDENIRRRSTIPSLVMVKKIKSDGGVSYIDEELPIVNEDYDNLGDDIF